MNPASQWRQRLREAGLCCDCRAPLDCASTVRCRACREIRRAAQTAAYRRKVGLPVSAPLGSRGRPCKD